MSEEKTHRGWFPIHEEALRIIDKTFDREGARRKAHAAYLTLSRIANLAGSETFTRSIASIARDMSYSYGHAAEALDLLSTAGLCTIEKRTIPNSKERAPSVYTLLYFGCTPKTDVQLLEDFTPRAENSQEPLQEPPKKNTKAPSKTLRRVHVKPPVRRVGRVADFEELIEMGYTDGEAEIIEYFNRVLVPHGYLPVNKFTEEVRKVCDTHEEGYQDIVDGALDEPRPDKGNNTFVRLGWDNY